MRRPARAANASSKFGEVQAANENLELYFLIKTTIEKIEVSFLVRVSYCTLFSQHR